MLYYKDRTFSCKYIYVYAHREAAKKSSSLNGRAFKGTVHSSNIWAKSLANGSLIIVL